MLKNCSDCGENKDVEYIKEVPMHHGRQAYFKCTACKNIFAVALYNDEQYFTNTQSDFTIKPDLWWETLPTIEDYVEAEVQLKKDRQGDDTYTEKYKRKCTADCKCPECLDYKELQKQLSAQDDDLN